ncbi:40280_t:CDS:2, partial [Gigaspora margarita]
MKNYAPKNSILSTNQEVEAFYTTVETYSSNNTDDELSDWTEEVDSYRWFDEKEELLWILIKRTE